MTIVASREKPWPIVCDRRDSQSVNGPDVNDRYKNLYNFHHSKYVEQAVDKRRSSSVVRIRFRFVLFELKDCTHSRKNVYVFENKNCGDRTSHKG